MAGHQMGPVYALDGSTPQIGSGVFVAPNAAVAGNVRIGDGASIWFSAVIRGDEMPVTIGAMTNVQDGAVIHSTRGVAPVEIGEGVVIGHGAILHGCRIGAGAMIGIGAIVLDEAVVGEGAVVAAGAIVPPGKQVPAGQLWMGTAGVRRPVNAGEKEFLRDTPSHYNMRAGQYYRNSIGAFTDDA